MKVVTYDFGINLYVTSPSDDSQRTDGQCGNNNDKAGDEPGNNWNKYKYAPSSMLISISPAASPSRYNHG